MSSKKVKQEQAGKGKVEKPEKLDKGGEKLDHSDREDVPAVAAGDFNLNAYINQYTGYTKIRRLVHIAERCPELQLPAFRAAISELKKGVNWQMYVECVSLARQALGERLGDEWGLDHKWLDNTKRLAHEKTTRLEGTLAEAKRIGDREPTRVAFMALAEHTMAVGDFTGALTKFLETKEYAGTNKHKVETGMAIMKASIDIGSLSHVKSQAQRIQSLPEVRDSPVLTSQINAALALQNLKSGSYLAAAQQLVGCTVDLAGPSAASNAFSDVMTVRDVGVYGAITLLASYSRRDIKKAMEGEGNTWKKVLESVPQWARVIQAFYTSKYALCFQTLRHLEAECVLDLHLGPHFHKLVAKIKERALIQYFRPYTCVKLPVMAEAFEMAVPVLERELVALIADNKIQARIDSHNKVLHARHSDQRSSTFQQSLEVGNRYCRDVKALLMRMSLVEHDFVIRNPDRKNRRRNEEEDKTG